MNDSMNNDTNNSTSSNADGEKIGYELPDDLKVAKFLLSTKGQILVNVVLYVLAWAPVLILAALSEFDTTGNNPLMVVIGGWGMISVALCTICGWRVLNRIQPTMFLWMSWIGWIIYFCVKLVIAEFIGLFVGPHYAATLLLGHVGERAAKRCKEIKRSRQG